MHHSDRLERKTRRRLLLFFIITVTFVGPRFKEFAASQLVGNFTAFSRWHNVIKLAKILLKQTEFLLYLFHYMTNRALKFLSLARNVSVYVSNILYCKKKIWSADFQRTFPWGTGADSLTHSKPLNWAPSLSSPERIPSWCAQQVRHTYLKTLTGERMV